MRNSPPSRRNRLPAVPFAPDAFLCSRIFFRKIRKEFKPILWLAIAVVYRTCQVFHRRFAATINVGTNGLPGLARRRKRERKALLAAGSFTLLTADGHAA